VLIDIRIKPLGSVGMDFFNKLHTMIAIDSLII